MFRSATTKIAHSSTIPSLGGNLNKDLRALQELILAEKLVLHSLQKLSSDIARSSDALRNWGTGEGDDLSDISTASGSLLLHFASALSKYAALEESIREQMKAIRTREEQLDDLKRRRKTVASKADAAEKRLSKMNPENKNLQAQTETLTRLRDEMRTMDAEIMSEEASLGDFKRYSVKQWMGLKFGGLQECCQKGAIIGELGKLVIAEIPLAQTQPGLPRAYYTGHARTEYLVAEANRVIQEVPFSTEPNQSAPSLSLPSASPDVSSVRQQPAPFQSPPPQSPRPLSMQYTGAAEISGGSSTLTYPPQMPMPPQGASMSANPNGQYGSSSFTGLPQVASQTSMSDFGLNSYLSQERNSPHPSEQPQLNEFGAYNNGPGAYAPQTSSMSQLPNRNSGSTASSPIEAQAGPRGGRFATFPVKGGPRPQPGATLPPMMGDRPPSIDVQRDAEESFASSVAVALGQQWPSSTPSPQPTQPSAQIHDPQVTSTDTKAAEAVSDKRSSYNSPPPVYTPEEPPAQHQPNPSTSAPAQQVLAKLDEEKEVDTGLAYLSNADVGDAEGALHPERPDRRVRFGSMRDIDEELDKREVEGQHQQQQSQQQSPVQQVPSPPVTSPSSPKSQPEASTHNGHAPPIIVAHRPQTPSFDENDMDEERALNAAAAREVSRELDALMFNSPLPPHPPPPPVNRTPSPLEPPHPPFARNSVSPRPEARPVAQAPLSISSNRRDSSVSPLGSRIEPQYVRERDRSASSPPHSATSYVSNSPTSESPLQPPPPLNIPDLPSPDGSASTPYRTPPEYPSGGPGRMYNMPGLTGSASSFTPSGGKIPAAAFKRGLRQATVPHDNGSETSLPDVGPLSVKKRPLPGTPYPSQGRLSAGESIAGMQRVSSAPSYGNSSSDGRAGGEERSSSTTNLSPMDNSVNHRRSSFSGGANDEDFDYISAYVNDSGSQQSGGAPHSGSPYELR